LTSKVEYKKITLIVALKQLWIEGKWVETEEQIEVWVFVDYAVRSKQDLTDNFIMGAIGRNVENGVMKYDHDYDSGRKDIVVHFDRERKSIGFEWRLLMTRVLLHPKMVCGE
jgi:hypothetical protein